MSKVEIRIEYRDPLVRAPALRKDAKAVLCGVDRNRAVLSLMLVSDVRMRELNLEFRGIDRTTDVLSFPQGGGPNGAAEVLGDVVISIPMARRQASRYRRTLALEVRRLLVHGVLHLLGHDHQKAAEARKMRGEERRLMALLRGRSNRR